MSGSGSNDADVGRWLAGVARTIVSVPYVWLATCPGENDFNVRPMGRLPAETDDSDWTIRFLTDGRSPKADDIRRGGQVAVLFQDDTHEAFVTARGVALLHEGGAQSFGWWKREYEVYFPTEQDQAHAAAIEFAIDRLDFWIRDVTPEPFGRQPTCLERMASGGWRRLSSEAAAAM